MNCKSIIGWVRDAHGAVLRRTFRGDVCNAVREAQRIILEAWDDKNYFDEAAHNRVAMKCMEVKE